MKQIRRRYGIPLPVELRFDEFTEDILANRLVKAAAARLGRMTLRSPDARRGAGTGSPRFSRMFRCSTSGGETCRRSASTGSMSTTAHVVGLARLVLLHSEFESFRGDVRASGFLIDMNILFQEFVTQALRETLGVSDRTLRDDKGIRRLTLAEKNKVQLKPDLSWWGMAKPVGSWVMPSTRR